jgi:uncharacterized repeat protein (TIGR03803 family)
MIRNRRPRASNPPMLLPASVAISLLGIQLLWLLFATPPAQAQTLTVLHTFTGKGDGQAPAGGVIRDASGNLYGTTGSGGSFDVGTVFRIDARGKETILHNFWSGDGLGPSSTLVRDQAGTLYGVAFLGGAPEGGECFFGCGAVFKLDSAGKESVLYAFNGQADGGYPEGDLLRDHSGNLYGTTVFGGGCRPGPGCGVVFKVDPQGKETVLYTFTGMTGNSPEPLGGLIRDKAGNLYGVTFYGGGNACGYGCGTIFKVDASGKETVFYSFTGGTDGGLPTGPLIRDAAGNLFGVTASGGDLSSCQNGVHNGCGVVFRLDRTGKETVLYAFKGIPDGASPKGRLLRDKSGNFYGVTVAGGTIGCNANQGCGTVFKLDANGKETVLYTFTGGSDGANPNGDLVMDESGNLYGTTSSGGDPSCYRAGGSCGVVFKLTP